MKTQNLHFEIYNTSNLVEATEKLTLETATDIFTITIWKRGLFGKRWKRVYSFMGFHGFCKTLLHKMNYWLEEYDDKDKLNAT